MVLRFNKFDVVVTILRRLYIPPFADTYQDVIISSRFDLQEEMDKDEGHQFENEIKRDRINQRCYEFLKKTHQAIIDSIHPTAIGSQRDFFKNIL